MNHSIHSLASQPNGKQQHPMLHHTLHPLVSSANSASVLSSQQQMLQFQPYSTSTQLHHQQQQQQQHHPYSTLHHPSQHPSNHHHNNTQPMASQTLHHFSQNLSHQQQQHQQQQQQQQQQYNMNSDYSSSTYHIYDQISDLIIIKQQRLERKLQLERRRKVILLSLALALLVSTSVFLVMQSVFGTNNANSQQQQQQASQQINRNQQIGEQSSHADVYQQGTWAPPAGAKASEWPFDASGLSQLPSQAQRIPNNNNIINRPILTSGEPCNGHGTVVIVDQQLTLCKCDPGYVGERCELPNSASQSAASYQSPGNNANPLFARCLLTNCNGNGQCNPLGLCQCFPGFLGPHCEFRLPPMQQSVRHQQQLPITPSRSSIAPNTEQAQQQQIQLEARCNCNGNGQCDQQLARCTCFAGFTGPNCLERDLCSERTCLNQGVCQPNTGRCQCKIGFKGTQCELRDDELWQRLLNCSHHGKFDYSQRKCVCDRGFAGIDCSEERCELADGQQTLDCGSNGLFDCRQNKCICQDGYSGDQCQLAQCSAQCSRNGQCIDGVCLCKEGFYGKHCSLNGCPNQCSGQGQCLRLAPTDQLPAQAGASSAIVAEWRCQCKPGMAGDDCSLQVERQCDDGIDNDKDGLVDCADSECCSDRACQNSTLCMKSPDPLDILLRKNPPPPTSSFFQRMQFLIEKFSSQIYTNPKDFNDSRASVIRGRVTYLKQGVTGVRVSVAGQINLGITLTRDGGYFDLMVNGGGAVLVEFRREPFATHQRAVRVPWNEIVLMDSVELALESPTAASFDSSSNSAISEQEVPTCSAHNYRLMRPQIVAAPKSWRKSQSATRSAAPSKLTGAGSSRAVILRDSNIVQQSIVLPGSANRQTTDLNANIATESANQSVSLVYISSRANEFMSTIDLQLTPADSNQLGAAKLPQELKLIYLKIVIEGNLFEQVFEPQTNLSFTYAWNRRNVYRQKSFGLSVASVSVGYEYFDCKKIIWTNKHIQLAGHDLSNSDIGSQWNLNIHHRYNYRDSTLQRGDGQNFNLKTDKALVVQPLMGDGYQREPMCPQCDGATTPAEQRLLRPQALVSAPDGGLYVGDFNLIRRIEPPGTAQGGSARQSGELGGRIVRTVLEFPSARIPSKYSLAMNLIDQKLYMADPDRHQIYLVREQGRSSSPQQPNASAGANTNETQQFSGGEESLVPVAGSGIKCQLEDRTNCGDKQPARAARLVEPKAIAFDLTGRMYIADGPNVRMVDTDNRMYTILGNYGSTRHTLFPCSGEAIPMHMFVPRAPLDLAFSPIDDTLHILDDNVVYKITQDKRVQIVAGHLRHCHPATQSGVAGEHSATTSTKRRQANGSGKLRATEVFLQSAQSISFGLNGDLFIADDHPKHEISRVFLVSPDEDTISLYAGLPLEHHQLARATDGSQLLMPTVDSLQLVDNEQLSHQQQQQQDKQQERSSNVLPIGQPTKALEYKFTSVSAMVVDQQGKLVVADKVQARLLSIEADLPQMNAAGEYELQSPDNGDELFVFNRYGLHIATREISSGQTQRNSNNKYTFAYTVNTSFGQLASVSYATGNKISIYRDGPHHSVKMIETAFGGQCKLDVSRTGQVHSISTIAPNTSKTNFSYQIDGGLLKQSRDQASGELFDFTYDEFGRAIGIQYSSPRLGGAPIECRASANPFRSLLNTSSNSNNNIIGGIGQQFCSALIVAE